MSSLINGTRAALLLLCAAGFYGTWYLLLNNGTMSSLEHGFPRFLNGTREPLKTSYTGIGAIDEQLTVLDIFFWEIVNGSNPAASLFSFHFATQVASGWSLLMVEGLRHGHRWRVISFIGTFGFLVQNVAYAVMLPIYLIVYLSTSPLLASKGVSDFLVDSADIAAIPISMVLGYVIPAIIMCLPAPSAIGFERKQNWMAVWQPFPVWVAIFQAVLPYLMPVLGLGQKASSTPSSKQSLKSLRPLYIGLIIVAGIGQVSTITLVATSKWFPSLFAPKFRGVFNPSQVFLPAAVTPSAQMSTIGSGVHLFLQYDETVGSTAMAIFTTVMYALKYQTSKRSANVASLVAQGLAIATLTGPLGYAVACIWARDEMVFSENDEEVKKNA